MNLVLDSSVVLALIWSEPGAEGLRDRIEGGLFSTVNFAESISKLTDKGVSSDIANAMIAALPLSVVPFDQDQALASGRLRETTRGAGLSLADRACLALAAAEGVPALTADRAWSRVDVGVRVELIR